MSTGQIILAAGTVFSGLILILVLAIALVEWLVKTQGKVKLSINGDEALSREVETGTTLLAALSNDGIILPSACGGKGTCGLCKCKVKEGGGDVLPTEIGHLTRAERKEGTRLACQVKVKNPMSLEIPDEIFNIKKFNCTVKSNHNVATFIKELILELDLGQELKFRAGGYIQIDIPAYSNLNYRDFQVEEKFQADWNKFNIWKYVANNPEACFRAYSMANHPAEGNRVMLNVRIATPPPNAPDAPPGISSSYIFSLKPGDRATVSGPFGEFFARETNNEMCFIGGGAGMAPMRSHIFHQFQTLKTKRKVTFWYGARSKKEMFYDDDFKKIAAEFPNFSYHVALSEPLPEDNWSGLRGFIHQVLQDEYLSKHKAPEKIEYYLCGPPPMIKAVNRMLEDLGVEQDRILYDEF